MEMTNREMDIWVAEQVMGWRLGPPERQGRSLVYWIKADGYGENDPALTSFSTSLSACTQAEEALRELDLHEKYALALHELLSGGAVEDMNDMNDGRPLGLYLVDEDDMFVLATATPLQRCHAMFEIRSHIEEARDARR